VMTMAIAPHAVAVIILLVAMLVATRT
jgi:hypothetical protein